MTGCVTFGRILRTQPDIDSLQLANYYQCSRIIRCVWKTFERWLFLLAIGPALAGNLIEKHHWFFFFCKISDEKHFKFDKKTYDRIHFFCFQHFIVFVFLHLFFEIVLVLIDWCMFVLKLTRYVPIYLWPCTIDWIQVGGGGGFVGVHCGPHARGPVPPPLRAVHPRSTGGAQVHERGAPQWTPMDPLHLNPVKHTWAAEFHVSGYFMIRTYLTKLLFGDFVDLCGNFVGNVCKFGCSSFTIPVF